MIFQKIHNYAESKQMDIIHLLHGHLIQVDYMYLLVLMYHINHSYQILLAVILDS